MDEKVAYPVVVIGPITTVAKELVAFFKKDPSCEIMHVESFETARAHIQQFPHCIVVGSIEAKEQLGATLGLLKALNLKTTRDRVKVLLVGKSNFAYLSEVMRALFVADYIIEPAAAKTVAFKARLQLNTLKIAVASGTAKKEEKSRTFNKALPTEGEKDQDSFRFKGKKAAPANEKFLIEDAAGVNAPSDGSNAVVSNDLDGSKLAQKADHTAEGETANAPEWKQNIVGEERSKDPAYEKAKNSLYEKARTAAAAAKILKSDSPAPTLKNAEIKAAQSPEEKNPEEVLVSKDEAAPAALSLLKKLSSENGKASAPNQKSSLGATAKAGQKPSFSEAGSGEAEAKAEWNSKTGGASETNLDELASTEFKDSEAPERKSGHGSNADKTALTPGVRTSDVKNLSPQEKEKIRAAAKKESERVEKERQAKSLQPSAANTGRAENELSHLGSANAKDAENVAEESDSEDSVAAKVAKLEKLKGEEVPEEKVVSEQLRSVFQRLAAKSDLKKKELEKSRVEAAEVVRVAQLHKKERQVAQAKEVQAESQRTRDLAHARTEAKRKAAPADNESEDLELPLSSRKKRKIESEEESEKKKRQEHQSEELLDEPEFNELESKEEQALDSGFEPDSFSPDITENTSSVFGHGGGEAAGTKINASDSDVSDPEVMWRAQKAALATLKKITWFYRTKTEISMLPGSWIQTDDGYYFLRKKIAADGIRIIQEALPLWIYRGKFAPDIHQDNLRWRFRETEPVRIVSSSELPAAILANVSKYLFEEGSVSKGLSSQAKSFKDSFENSLSADSFDANSSEESGPDNGGLLADELAETDAGAGAKISNASDAEGEDIFGRKELRKKAKAEAAAEAEAAALVASDKKSKNSELDAELDAELEDAFHDSLEESIAEEEEHHDSEGLDLKAKKAKREADDSLAEGSLDQKKARKNTELENAEEGFEKEELSSESDLQGSDSEAQSSNAEEEISASDRAQESETEKDIEDIFSAAAKAKSRRGTKDISAQESEEESEKERNADSALTHLAESVSAEVDSESADQAQVRKKKRRGIFAALKEKLAPKQSLEAKEEKAAKRRE
ncbi:MAG: hypothetical protein ACXWQJ_12945, partial [Bdellovibrionota bacterium]